MVDSDPSAGGLGLRSLQMEQGLETIFQLISLWNAPTPAFYLFRSSLELLKIEAGPVR